MSDAFGKVIGFLLAAVLLFVIPVNIAVAEQKATTTMYIYTELCEICERVRNTGSITRESYDELCSILSGCVKGYRLDITAEASNGGYISDSEITEVLATEGIYKFHAGCFIRFKVSDDSGARACCGGMIKYYETD